MLRSRGRGAAAGGVGVAAGGRGGHGGAGRGGGHGGAGQGGGHGGAGRGGGHGGAGCGGGQNAAQLLLQKASTQLRGERVPIKPREEDELASYLNSLTQKTSQQAKSVNYEEFGDISISSGADPTPRVGRTPSPAPGAGSKFLKKKAQPVEGAATPAKKTPVGGAYGVKPSVSQVKKSVSQVNESDDDDDDDDIGMKVQTGTAESRGATPKFSSAPVAGAKRGGFQMSSALNKASALANKITQRSAGSAASRKTRSSLMDSDTDESLGPLLRSSKRGGKGSRPGSASDSSVGRDGNKFMKKKGGSAEAKPVEEVKKSGRQSPARPAAKEKPRTKSPAEGRSKGRGGGGLLRGSSNVYLTSEEESLAEFIQGLSGSDESRPSQRKAKQVPAKSIRQASRSPSPSPSPQRRSRRQSPSPSPSPKVKGRSVFHGGPAKPVFHRAPSQDSDSVTSEMAESRQEKIMIADSISVDEPLEINLMDAHTLGAIVLTTPEPASYSEVTKRSSKARPSPFKRSGSPAPSQRRKSKDKGRKASKKKKEKSSSVFESFGIQSVEDLLGAGSDKENSDNSEIPTEPLPSRKRRTDHSTSQIVTEIHSRTTPQRQVSYSEDFEASISERIGGDRDRSKGRWARKVSASSIATQCSDEETGMEYTEDFASETLSLAKYSESDRSSHYRYSDDETDATETISETKVKEARPGGRKVVVESRSVEIQTAAPAGLSYQWLSQTGVSLMAPSYGLDAVDPTPIAATVISPDALETMTAYSPATLAIHDMLKQQVELIKQFAQAHQRLYHALSDSNLPSYKYTTLEGTKAFIEKHRKPRLTMKQALKMVDEEMRWNR